MIPMNYFFPGEVYSHEEIYRTLQVGNAGGIRLSADENGNIRRGVLLTSVPLARMKSENPYHDRIESDVLIYTGAGQEGNQALGGINKRILDQIKYLFPLYCFLLLNNRRRKDTGNKRWQFLGLLHYIRHYKETQVDVNRAPREVWMFEFHLISSFKKINPEFDQKLMTKLVEEEENLLPSVEEDRVLEHPVSVLESIQSAYDPLEMEHIRARMLALPPARFEYLIKDVLLRTGFTEVQVTQYSQDGGIDVNAIVGKSVWPLRDLLVQLQAKRWLHTVGRKEVAELRGSLQPHAHGAIVTTSQFSKAAVSEASEVGKQPIVLVDGYDFSRIVTVNKIILP